MKCLRCGYCCQNSFVMVVDDPEKGIADGNLKAIGDHGPERCPHLRGNISGQFSCAVHDRPWYPETPCFSHAQIEGKDSPCRMGEFQLQRRDSLIP